MEGLLSIGPTLSSLTINAAIITSKYFKIASLLVLQQNSQGYGKIITLAVKEIFDKTCLYCKILFHIWPKLTFILLQMG